MAIQDRHNSDSSLEPQGDNSLGRLGHAFARVAGLGWHLTPHCACPQMCLSPNVRRSGFQHGSIARIALADKVERIVGVGELETLDLRTELVARGELQHLVD